MLFPDAVLMLIEGVTLALTAMIILFPKTVDEVGQVILLVIVQLTVSEFESVLSE